MRLMTGQRTQRVIALVTGCCGGALTAFVGNIPLGAGIIGLGFLLIGAIGAWGYQKERSLTVGELVAIRRGRPATLDGHHRHRVGCSVPARVRIAKMRI